MDLNFAADVIVLANMNELTFLRIVLTAGSIFLALAARADAQATMPPDAELPGAISALDTALFDAYNRCDLPKLASFIDEDIEFYHDQTGLSVGRQNLVDGIRKNICGKVNRELVQGTLEVYPLHGYGAVEIGIHRFRHPGVDDNIGEAKFVHVWRFKDGAWKVTRVISFNHHPLPK
jgi:ketosteroid isomerase-like protein